MILFDAGSVYPSPSYYTQKVRLPWFTSCSPTNPMRPLPPSFFYHSSSPPTEATSFSPSPPTTPPLKLSPTSPAQPIPKSSSKPPTTPLHPSLSPSPSTASKRNRPPSSTSQDLIPKLQTSQERRCSSISLDLSRLRSERRELRLLIFRDGVSELLSLRFERMKSNLI